MAHVLGVAEEPELEATEAEEDAVAVLDERAEEDAGAILDDLEEVADHRLRGRLHEAITLLQDLGHRRLQT